MEAHRVLILSTVELAATVVRAFVGESAETVVVVPAVRQSRLQWLANDEDRARGTAERAAERLADATPGTTVVARAGDSDPVVAMQDALREFKADEIIIVTKVDDDAGWLEERASEIGEVGGNIPFARARLGSDGSVTLDHGRTQAAHD